MARFGFSSLVRKSRSRLRSSSPLGIVSEEDSEQEQQSNNISATCSQITSSTSIFDHSGNYNDAELSSASSFNDNAQDIIPQDSHDHLPALTPKRSFSSSVDTLFVNNDTTSTVNTLLADSQSQSTTTRQQQYAGNSRALPIYATRFKSGVQVFESDLAAKVFRTLNRGNRKQQAQQSASTSAAQSSSSSSNLIPMPPALSCQTLSSYNPFSSKKIPFMTINRLGKTVHSPSSGNRPRTLLADTVLQHHVELGLAQHDDISTTVTEETMATKPFCQVWQTVLSNDQVEYTIEFDNALDYAQPTITLRNDGRRRVTHTSYDGVRMQWNGTTGLGSPFGSGYFELRFSDQEQLANQPQQLRPPVAVYHNVGAKTLSSTRKVGEFVIWEPGFEFADIIVIMGMVLREQEQRKEIEGHTINSNLLATF